MTDVVFAVGLAVWRAEREIPVPLGTICEAVPLPSELVIDATGEGRPVLDLLRQSGHSPVAVSIIGNGSERLDPEDLIWRAPKERLMLPLAGAMEARRLSIAPDLQERETLKFELAAFHRKLNERVIPYSAGSGSTMTP
jgi:hypothetical protein